MLGKQGMNRRHGISHRNTGHENSTSLVFPVQPVRQSITNMTTITEALVLEHSVLCQMFDQIERVLVGSQSTQEVKSLAAVVEGMLSSHGEIETNLAYSVMDHVLAERRTLHHLHQDHHELDGNFARIHRAKDPAKALRLLKKALAATREHFRREEQSVFPVMQEILQPETLRALGSQWRK
jgi:hemerythrin-like domain-containing protein